MKFRKYINNGVFIDECIKIHSDKYIYDEAVYTGPDNDVTIICPKHGKFKIKAKRFLLGNGCYKCGRESSASKQRKSKEQFLSEVKKLFGDSYWDLSKVEYFNSKTKIIVGCYKHGYFWISPTKLLSGQGCPKCRHIKSSKSRTISSEEFIKRATERWGSTYDYSKVKYVNSHTKVNIVCPIHGDFFQAPNKHVSGDGCPKCSSSKGERLIDIFLKNNNIPYKRQYIFRDCKYKSYLKFDFVIFNSDESIKFIIEFQGQQHFKPYERFGGIKGFESQLKRDKIKFDYCKSKGIQLIYMNYKTSILKQLKKIFGNSWKY